MESGRSVNSHSAYSKVKLAPGTTGWVWTLPGNCSLPPFVLFIEVINAQAKRSNPDDPADIDVDVRQRDPVPALRRAKKNVVSLHLGNSTFASTVGAGATARGRTAQRSPEAQSGRDKK